MKNIWINQQKVALKAADLIQSGGEGMVFAWTADQVIKLYHAANKQHEAKLQAMISQQISKKLPDHVFAPQEMVYDQQINGRIIGFVMGRLPSGYQPFKRLSSANHTQKHGITLEKALSYLQTLQESLATLHQNGLVVGDLNDQNLFFDPKRPGHIAQIDVDSYQIGPHPCPVAMQPFVDPNLYPVNDFSLRPYFSPATDWYAFAVLMVRTILLAHPYGGVHAAFKSLTQRAENRVSILSPNIKYPPKARPPAILSPALRQLIGRIFDQGERPLITADPLNHFAQYLQNPTHPAPLAQYATPHPAPSPQPLTNKSLLETSGQLIAVWPQPHNSRYYALVHEEGTFSLIYGGVGGVIDNRPLFNGTADYRFDLFGHYLLVNPPGRRQLLVLDIEQATPQRVAMLETDIFRDGATDTAVFATTAKNYYRLTNGYIMQGEIIGDAAVDGVTGTAYQNQTRLWGSPHNNSFMALHRSFGDYAIYAQLHNGTTFEQTIQLPSGTSVKQVSAAFAPDSASLLLQLVNRGTESTRLIPLGETAVTLPFVAHSHAHLPSGYYFATDNGLIKWKNGRQIVWPEAADLVTAEDILHPHPRGVLVQQTQKLLLIEI